MLQTQILDIDDLYNTQKDKLEKKKIFILLLNTETFSKI